MFTNLHFDSTALMGLWSQQKFMVRNKKIKVKGIEIIIFQQKDDDYISLTDIAKYKNPEAGLVISHWLSTRFAIEFMGIWERINNPNFKVTEFSNFKKL